MAATRDRHRALARPLALGGDGPTVGVKECLDIAGLTTRCGSAALADAPPAASHAAAVRNLIDANCRIVGMTVMHELAFGITGLNEACGTPVNPRWPDLIPGGSSSGSAVLVAEGACDFAIGTDTGGSIRLPACCCGVYGFKPSFGLVDRRGAIPAESSLDCIGVLAREPQMLARAMAALVPGFAVTPLSTPPRLKRIAVAADAEIAQALDRRLAALAPPSVELPGLEAAFAAGLSIMSAETWTAFGHLLGTGRVGTDVRARLEASRAVTAEQVAHAETVRAAFTGAVDAALADADALVLPTLPSVPPASSEIAAAGGLLRITAFVRPFNLSGHPALSIPIVTDSGLPAALQIVGRKGGDAKLCAVAEWLC